MAMQRIHAILRLFVFAILIAGLIWPAITYSEVSAEPEATFTVDDTGDLVDDNLTDGICHTSAGTCTLRAAIQEANVTTEADAIDLQVEATYILSIAGTGEGLAASGDLDIRNPVTINGNGSTVDANLIDRVIEVRSEVTINDLTIQGGTASTGGGIYFYPTVSDKHLYLNHVNIIDNYSSSNGGGIYAGGTNYNIHFSGCEIHSNQAAGQGEESTFRGLALSSK